MSTFPQAERAVADATKPGASVTQREQALEYLLGATEYHADISLLQYVTHQIPVLTATLREWRETALGKAYDLMEGDMDEIRILGYKLALALGQQHGASMGEVTDVLSQALIASIGSEDYTAREQEELFLAVRMIIRLDPAALTIILPAIMQDPSPEKRDKLCEYLQRETFATVGSVLRSGERAETEAAIRGECERAITSADPTMISFGMRLLAVLPSITGQSSNRETVSFITEILVKCIERETDPRIIQSYFSQLSFLLAETMHQPDPRWFLYLYCAKPLETARWAQKRPPAPQEAPSKLMDWLRESWNLWRLAHENPEIKGKLPQELQITELSRMCKIVLAQLPVFLPARITAASLVPIIDQLELQLLLAYFIFLKFRGQLENIYDDHIKLILDQISRTASDVLEKTVGPDADPVKARKWHNVSRMSYNLVNKGSLDTIVPSWQIIGTSLSTNAPTGPANQASYDNQLRRPHVAKYPQNGSDANAYQRNNTIAPVYSGSNLSAISIQTTQRAGSIVSPSVRSSQLDTTQRTASDSSTHSGSSKRKRDFANRGPASHNEQSSSLPVATQSKGLAERLGIPLPSTGGNDTTGFGNGHDQDAQRNKKRKAKPESNQVELQDSGVLIQRPTPGTAELSPGMSLLQRLNMGGGGNSAKHANSSMQSNSGNAGSRSTVHAARAPPRVRPNVQRNGRPNPTQSIRPDMTSNVQSTSMLSFSPTSVNSTTSASTASSRLKLSSTPKPSSLVSRLSEAPAHARSPIPMAPIASDNSRGLVKSAGINVDFPKSSIQGAAPASSTAGHLQPLGQPLTQPQPTSDQPPVSVLPFNPNDGIKRKGRGFANAGYAV